MSHQEEAPDAKPKELTSQSVINAETPAKEPLKKGRRKRQAGAAKPAPQDHGKNAPAQGGAPAPMPADLTATATEAGRVMLAAPPILSDSEAEVYALIVVKRMSPQNAAQRMNKLQNTQAWSTTTIRDTLQAARAKVEKLGEAEAARPLASVTQETRDRYDALIGQLNAELERMAPEAGLPDVWLGARAKVTKMVADIEAMRDSALQALSPAPGTLPGGSALLYVSKLRG